jgi:PTS system mannose-specific IID component
MTGGLRKRMFLRSLAVQASWNFEKLQNLGFFLLVCPALEERYSGSGKLGEALKRHLDFFNTHPYFAGLVAGAVVREEGGDLDQGRFLEDLKRSLMSTMASIGDGFFWAALKPFAILAAIVPALFGAWWSPLVLLAVYNVPHLSLRWWGIGAGLEEGCRVIESVQRLPFSRLVPLLSLLAAALAGLAAGVASVHPNWAPLPGRKLSSLVCAVVVFTGGVFLSGRRAPSKRVLAGAAGVLLLGAAFVEATGS